MPLTALLSNNILIKCDDECGNTSYIIVLTLLALSQIKSPDFQYSDPAENDWNKLSSCRLSQSSVEQKASFSYMSSWMNSSPGGHNKEQSGLPGVGFVRDTTSGGSYLWLTTTAVTCPCLCARLKLQELHDLTNMCTVLIRRQLLYTLFGMGDYC